MTQKPTRTRRMEEFTLNEISFVTKPAQTPALGAIIKGDFSDVSDADLLNDDYWKALESELEKNGDLAQLSSTVENDHEHAIRMTRDEKTGKIYVWVQHASSTEDSHGHEHQIVAAPDGTYRLTENVGHTHEIDQSKFSTLLAQMAVQGMEKASPDAQQEAGATSQPVGKKETSMTDEIKKDLEKTQKENQTLKAQIAELTNIAKMTGEEKTFMEGLDAEKQKTFKEMSAEDRRAMMAEMKKSEDDASEVVFKSIDGEEFTKSDDPRLVALAKRADDDRKQLLAEKASRENDRLEKAANEQLQYLPGDIKTRAALLKAAEGIDGGVDVLKAHNASMSPAFKTVGKLGGHTDERIEKKADAEIKLGELAKGFQAEDANLTYADAYVKAMEENPNIADVAIAG